LGGIAWCDVISIFERVYPFGNALRDKLTFIFEMGTISKIRPAHGGVARGRPMPLERKLIFIFEELVSSEMPPAP